MAHGESDLTPDPLQARLRAAAAGAGGGARRTPDCPDAADIATLVAGDGEAAATFLSHASTCDYCGPLVDAAMGDMADRNEDRALLEGLHTARPEWRRQMAFRLAAAGRHQPHVSRAWLVVGGGLAAAAAIVLAVGLQPDWLRSVLGVDAADPRLAKLVAAVGDERYTAARLTGGFHYGPVRVVTRGPEELSQRNLELLAAAGEIQKISQRDPSAANLHAWGIAQVLLGDVDGAIDSLSSAVQLDSSNASTLADLAAAHLARFTERGSAADLPAALERLEQALGHDPDQREALFNRGQVLEALGLRTEARSAWEAYLERDSTSLWADEARRRRQSLVSQSAVDPEIEQLLVGLVSDRRPDGNDFQAIREFVEEELLGRQLAGADTASSQTTMAPDRITRLAAYLTRVQGDALLEDAISGLRDRDARRVSAARRGFACYARARSLQRETRSEEMSATAARCAADFREAGSPFVRWTTVMEARAAQSRGDLATSERLITGLASMADAKRYPITRAWIDFQHGALAFLRSDYDNAQSRLAAAIAGFEAAGEREHAAGASDVRAAALFEAGRRAEAWVEHRRALNLLPDRMNSARWYATRNSAAMSMLNSGYPRAAAVVLLGNLGNSEKNGAVLRVAETLRYLSRSAEMVGDTGVATSHLETARSFLASLREDGASRRLRAELLMAEAELLARSSPSAAAEQLRQSHQLFEQLGIEPRLARLKLFEARAARATSGATAAADAASAGLALVDRQEAKLASRRLRAVFRTTTVDLYREAISAKAELGLAKEALLNFEQLRRSGPDSPSMRDLETGIQALPSDTATIIYAVNRDEVLRWTVVQGEVSLDRLKPTPATLGALIAAVRAGLIVGANARTAQGRQLADLLLGELPQRAHAAKRWVLILDADLYRIPFAMLPDGQKVLVDRREIAVASSLLHYVRGQAAVATRQPGPLRAAVFASTEFDRDLLRPLPNALREAERIAALYGVRPVTGKDASTAAFVEAIGSADIVHFAGHAVLDSRAPWRSQLILAPNAENPTGSLFQTDIEDLRARATVVVLAGCSTADGNELQGEGVSSVARSFSRAGVPWVIATLWPISDDAAADVFERLHAFLSQGLTPPGALRHLQSDLRADSFAAIVSSLVVIG